MIHLLWVKDNYNSIQFISTMIDVIMKDSFSLEKDNIDESIRDEEIRTNLYDVETIFLLHKDMIWPLLLLS